ncbi:hypothetical protein BDR03DRAFT_964626 [Suillus americanus]|nr:hypothetical protein BDR03DRAFT_964626 [Suillus americanus]
MNNKLNRTVKPRRCHRTLNLPMPQHPRHLLVLPQVQQSHSHPPSHCVLGSCCFSAVHLPHTPTATNTVGVPAFGPLLHLCFYLFHTCIFSVMSFNSSSILFPCRGIRAVRRTR